MSTWLKITALAFGGVLLSACGGGGGGDSEAPGNQPDPGTLPTTQLPDISDAQISETLGNQVNLRLLSSQGPIDRCSVTPVLPTGLQISSADNACVISGRVEQLLPATQYQLTASNDSGSDSAQLQIEIHSNLTAPTIAIAQASINTGQPFTVRLENTGGAIEQCSVTPDLPVGIDLQREQTACVISGTSEVEINQQYQVRAVNSAGQSDAQFTLNITALVVAPVLADATFNGSYDQMVSVLVNNSGGSANCSIQPDLPTGLTLQTVANGCRVSGSAAEALQQSYQLTAVNSAGISTAQLQLSIVEPLTAPQLQLPALENLYSKQQLNLVISNNGGELESCSITPDLPPGLSLLYDSGRCVISGEVDQPLQQRYQLTARNAAGSSSLALILDIQSLPLAPQLSGLAELQVNQGDRINVAISNSGDPIFRCAVTPRLISGLSVEMANNQCVLTGTATRSIKAASYKIIGTNTVGTGEHILSLTINAFANSWGDGPDPADFDHVVRMVENEFDAVNKPGLINENDDRVLELSTRSTPVAISRVELDNGDALSDVEEIQALFEVQVNSETGAISLHKNKGFDYEADSHFYRLTVQLGDDETRVLVRLYDMQQGSEEEVLKLHSYSELVSFSQGELQPDGRLFEIIDAGENHNLGGHYIELQNDIDASESADTPFQRFEFSGRLHGNNYVINRLNMPDGFFTSAGYFELRHIGFPELTSTSRTNFIADSDNDIDDHISHVFFSGELRNSLGTEASNRLAFTPIAGSAISAESLYVNLYHKARDGIRTSLLSNGSVIGGLIHNFSPGDFRDGYVSGSLHTDRNRPMALQTSCFSPYQFNGRVGNFYCAKDYYLTNEHASKIHNSKRDRYQVYVNAFEASMSTNFNDYNGGWPEDSSAPFRYVINRSDDSMPRPLGNGRRDGADKDGVADDWGCSRTPDFCPVLEPWGMMRDEFKQADSWSGSWTDNGRWDIKDGEWPVLTDMPYPHEANSHWLHAADPGVEYQRWTYNDYLSADRPQDKVVPVVELPTIQPLDLPQLNQGSVVDIKIPAEGEILSCRAVPQLPDGLQLVARNNECYLSGTPQAGSASQTLVIEVANAAGSSSIQVQLEVLPEAPLLRDQPDVSVTRGESIEVNFYNGGGKLVSCSSDALPLGLTIKKTQSSCLLSGVTAEINERRTYQITASNAGGSATASINIEVLAPLMAPQLSGNKNIEIDQGTNQQFVYHNSGDALTACEVSPDLPRGLTLVADLQSDSCIIRGNALAVVNNQSYQLQAENSGGVGQFEIALTVNAQPWNGYGPSPYGFDAIATMEENVEGNFNEAQPDILTIAPGEDALVLHSQGFPNRISRIVLTDGTELTEDSDIGRYFKLEKSSADTSLRILKAKSYDYENNDHFYQLTLQLGTEEETVLVRLYDVQKGTRDEVLKIHSYDELLSFSQGLLQSDLALFEVINAGENHNVGGHYIELENDIDASPSADNPFERFEFAGRLQGNNHVVKNLNMPDGLFTSAGRFELQHIGFPELTSASQTDFIRDSDNDIDDFISHVFFSGELRNSLGTQASNRLFFTPIYGSAIDAESVYVNLYHHARDGVRTSSVTNGSVISGLITNFSPGDFRDGYVTGSLHTHRTKAMALQTSCFSQHQFNGLVGNFYCAKDYYLTNEHAAKIHNSNRDRYQVFVNAFEGNMSTNFNDYGDGWAENSTAPFRYVINRSDDSTPRPLGNGRRDGADKDGIADEWGCSRTPDFCAVLEPWGMMRDEFKRASSWSGSWTESGRWDISDGEWPVLTDMPYPHDDGEAWMDERDPGVAYQRATYDDYLTAEN